MVKRLIGLLRGYLIVVGVLTSCFLVFFTLSINSLFKQSKLESVVKVEPISVEDFVLHFKVDGHIKTFWKDSDPFSSLVAEPENASLTAWEVRQSLISASKDDRVRGLLFELGPWSVDWSGMELILEGMKEFRDSGKSLYVAAVGVETRDLLLGAFASQFSLAPAGSVHLFGSVAQGVYYGEALRKLGLDFYITKVGKYKSAFESLVQKKPSPASVEAMLSQTELVNQVVWSQLTQGRPDWKPGKVRSWFAKSIYSATGAHEAGIVDQLAQPHDVLDLLKKGSESQHHVLLSRYLAEKSQKSAMKLLGDSSDGLALIDIVGGIQLVSSSSSDANAESLVEQLQWAAESDKVKGVLLRIDSPGGSALASDLIWARVRALANQKPVVAIMEGVAASGGYYIASAADKIVASPLTLTGSIGVIGLVPSFQRFADKWDLGFHSQGHTKRLGLIDVGKPLTREDKEILQDQTDQAYRLFLERISEARGLAVEDIHKVAQGRVWLGKEALEFGLVDDLGGWTSALAMVKQKAGLNPDLEYSLYRYGNPYDRLFQFLKKPQRILPTLHSFGFLTQMIPLAVVAGLESNEFKILEVWRKDPLQAIYLGETITP